MTIIEELERLKSEIAGCASTEIELCTMPPQHPFASWVSVESIISKIDKIIETEKNKKFDYAIFIAMQSYIDSYVDSGGPCTQKFIQGLYSYMQTIEAQYDTLITQNQDLYNKLSSLKDFKEKFAFNFFKKIRDHS